MALGKNQVKALRFLHKYPGWHYFSQDSATQKIVKGLKSYKLVSIDRHGRMKITKLGNRFIWESVGRFYL